MSDVFENGRNLYLFYSWIKYSLLLDEDQTDQIKQNRLSVAENNYDLWAVLLES